MTLPKLRLPQFSVSPSLSLSLPLLSLVENTDRGWLFPARNNGRDSELDRDAAVEDASVARLHPLRVFRGDSGTVCGPRIMVEFQILRARKWRNFVSPWPSVSLE